MDNYIEFQRFPDLDSASDLIDIFETNDILYVIDDSAMRFDIAATSNNPLDKQILIKIKDVDFEKANRLNSTLTNPNEVDTNVEHYLYTFSDNDIIGVMKTPSEWTQYEVDLAKKISEERGLKVSAQIERLSSKVETNERMQNDNLQNMIKLSSLLFLFFAIPPTYDYINSLIYNKFLHKNEFGLTKIITEYLSEKTFLSTSIFNFLFSGFFIAIWFYAKKKRHWAYLTGMILITIDTSVFILNSEWFSTGVHLFSLLMIYNGYNSIFVEKGKTVA